MIKFGTEPATGSKDAQPVAKREAAPIAIAGDLLDGDVKGAGDKPKAKKRIGGKAAAKAKS